MGQLKFAWALWIAGTILILLSWTDTVTPTVGWVGFGIALGGFVLGRLPSNRHGPSDEMDNQRTS